MQRQRPMFETAEDAMVRLRRFGQKGSSTNTKVFYVEQPIGLKFLGAVDFLTKQKVLVVFDKKAKHDH